MAASRMARVAKRIVRIREPSEKALYLLRKYGYQLGGVGLHKRTRNPCTFIYIIRFYVFCRAAPRRGFAELADAEYVWSRVAFALFIVLQALLVFAEKKTQDPVSDMLALYILSFCTQNGMAWLLPQVLADASLAGEVNSVIATLTLVASILCPLLNKKMTSRVVMCVSYAVTIAFSIGVVFALVDQTAYIVVNAITTFTMCFLQMTIYPALMVAVP